MRPAPARFYSEEYLLVVPHGTATVTPSSGGRGVTHSLVDNHDGRAFHL